MPVASPPDYMPRLQAMYLLESAGRLEQPEQDALNALRQAGRLPPPGDPAEIFPADHPYQWFNRQAEQRHGLLPGLLNSIQDSESSGGNARALSKRGVRGAYQITGPTGEEFGLTEANRGKPWAEANAAAAKLAFDYKRTNDWHQAVNAYAAPEDRGWYADTVLARLGGSALTNGVEGPATTSSTTTTRNPFLRLGQRAIEDTLGAPVDAALMQGRLPTRGELAQGPLPTGARAIGRMALYGPGLGPSGPADVLDAFQLVRPLNSIIPIQAIKGAIGDSISPGLGDYLQMVPTGLPTSVAGRVARVIQRLTPTAREASALANAENVAKATQGSRYVANVGTAISNAGQLNSRMPLGRDVQAIADAQAGRLESSAQQALAKAKATTAASPVGPQLQALNQPPPPPVPFYDARGRSMPLQAPVPPNITMQDIPPRVHSAELAGSQAGARSLRYAGSVQGPVRQLGMSEVPSALYHHPDLAQAMLAVATPEEIPRIRQAIAVGAPLSSLPFSADQLSVASSTKPTSSGLVGKLGKLAVQAGFGGAAAALGGGGTGALIAATVATPATFAFIDWAMNKPATMRLVQTLIKAAPDSADWAAAASRIMQLAPTSPSSIPSQTPPGRQLGLQ